MQAKYGATWLPDRKLALAFNRRPQISRFGTRVNTKIDIPFRGVVTGTNPTTLQTAMEEIETAFSLLNQDFILYHDDKTTQSIHKLLATDTLDGTRVTFRWLDPKGTWRGSGMEYVRWRSFAGVIEGELDDPEQELVEWHEQIYQQGNCGNQIVAQEAMAAPPIIVTPQAAGSSGVLIQEGYGVGWSDYLPFPAYAYPLAAMARQSAGWRLPPIYGRNTWRMFPIRWRYHHALTASAIEVTYPTWPPVITARTARFGPTSHPVPPTPVVPFAPPPAP